MEAEQSHLPDHWIPMDVLTEGFILHELEPAGSDRDEFQMVDAKFHATLEAGYKIEKVYRVQNPMLWQAYNG